MNLVVVVAFLNQLGSFASSSELLGWLIGAVVGTILAIIGFVVAILVINWAGRIAFKADVSFNELVRTLGLAYVWQVVGVLGIPIAFSDIFSGELYMIKVLAVVMLIISWLVAAKEALDLGWLQTGVTVLLGWIAQQGLLMTFSVMILMLLLPWWAASTRASAAMTNTAVPRIRSDIGSLLSRHDSDLQGVGLTARPASPEGIHGVHLIGG
jgi:hypothetical protein